MWTLQLYLSRPILLSATLPHPAGRQVCDFNLSKLMNPQEHEGGAKSVMSSTLGVTNPRWLAPEVLEGAPPSFASVSLAGRLFCFLGAATAGPADGPRGKHAGAAEVGAGRV